MPKTLRTFFMAKKICRQEDALPKSVSQQSSLLKMSSLSCIQKFKPVASGGSIQATYSLIPNHATAFADDITRDILTRKFLRNNTLLVPSSGAATAKVDRDDFSEGDRMCDYWHQDEEKVLKGQVPWAGGEKYVEECARTLNILDGEIFAHYLPGQDRFFLCKMGSFESIKASEDLDLYHTQKPIGQKGPTPLLTKKQLKTDIFWPATSLTREIEVIGQVLKEDIIAYADERGIDRKQAWSHVTGLSRGQNCIELQQPKHFSMI